jgi:hypothetical protein
LEKKTGKNTASYVRRWSGFSEKEQGSGRSETRNGGEEQSATP